MCVAFCVLLENSCFIQCYSLFMLILYSAETADVDICNRKIRDDSNLHINGITTNMKYEKKTCKILQ